MSNLVSVTPTVGITSDYLDTLLGNFYGGSGGTHRQPQLTFQQQLTAGVLANQADTLHIKTYSIVSGSPVTINLFDGSLKAPDLTTNAAFVGGVGGFIYYNRDPTNNVTMAPAASNGWTAFLAGTTPTLTFKKNTVGMPFCSVGVSADLYAVASGNCQITFTASAGTVIFDFGVWGHSS